MAISGTDLLRMCRVLLRDVPDGNTDPPSTRYGDAAILRALTMARDAVARGFLRARLGLFSRDDLGSAKWASLGMARITVNRLFKTAAAGDAVDVPTDFWKLDCGINDDGRYVPAEDIHFGEAFSGQGFDQIYAKGGKFYGTAATAYYWAMPTGEITDSATALGYFPDSVYHVVRLLACQWLLQSERAESIKQYLALQQLVQRRIMSYR